MQKRPSNDSLGSFAVSPDRRDLSAVSPDRRDLSAVSPDRRDLSAVSPDRRDLSLRPATLSDLDVCCAIAEQAMRDSVERTWGSWNSAEQDQRVRDYFDTQTHQMVMLADQIIGLLVIEIEATHLLLAKLYLLASYQNQGIGTQLIHHALALARQQEKPLRLRVLKANQRAKVLYEREGFAVYDQSETHWMMQSQLSHTL
jgi:GNAT superfamily N-acetyltransferase